MRTVVIFIGAVTLIVGVIGLLAPVSVSPDLRTVDCGSAVSPELPEALTRGDGDAARSGPEADYSELCSMDLHDRRVLAVTTSLAGLVLLASGFAFSSPRRSPRRVRPAHRDDEQSETTRR